MASNESIKPIVNKIIEDATNNETQISCSVGDVAIATNSNVPQTKSSEKSNDKMEEAKKTHSEPSNLQKFTNTNPLTSNMEPLDNARALPFPEEKKSTFSLQFQSEILNIPNRSNVTLKSCIQFNEDGPRPCQTTTLSRSESLLPQISDHDGNQVNAGITVLYSENVSFASSESLLAKDSMGQSLLHLNELRPSHSIPKGASTSPTTIQPPPYHVATAQDTASLQITPASGPPLVLYSAPPLQGAPPTYSALMRIGPQDAIPQREIFSRRSVQIQPSAPFIAPPPPPSYAQAQGYCVAHPLQFADPQDSVWNTEPVTVICPYCNNFIVTSVRFRRSNLTHYSALALCICGCWPCCLLPYCMKSCKCAHHECPICSNIVGIYSPWQVS